MQMLNVSALITGYETVGDHTEFVAQVSCNGDLWLISRRFSDFDQLHSRLASRFGALLGDARLPEKQWFGRCVSSHPSAATHSAAAGRASASVMKGMRRGRARAGAREGSERAAVERRARGTMRTRRRGVA